MLAQRGQPRWGERTGGEGGLAGEAVADAVRGRDVVLRGAHVGDRGGGQRLRDLLRDGVGAAFARSGVVVLGVQELRAERELVPDLEVIATRSEHALGLPGDRPHVAEPARQGGLERRVGRMERGEPAEFEGAQARAESAGGAGPLPGGLEPMPSVLLTRRKIISSALFVLLCVGFLYFILPKLTGIGRTVHRIEGGDTWWIAIGVLFEVLSFAGYVVLFRAVFVRGQSRIGWRESYEITMAGLVATRLFAAAGAGGVAMTAWAVRRSGMEPRLVATRMVAFIVLLYVIYAGSLLIDGIGLGAGLFPGGGSFAITIVPAIVAT